MVKTFKIYISKEGKIIELDEALVLNQCHKMYIKSVSIFWDYNNLDETYFFNYDVDNANTKVTYKKGYYTFNTIKKLMENVGNIDLEAIKETGKCKIRSDKKVNLKSLSPILGFSSNKEIAANTWVTSENVVNINNNLEYVEISCNLIDKNKNFTDGKTSGILIQIQIPSDKSLKGDVSHLSNSDSKEGISLSNGIYNELEFKVEGNNSSFMGNVLLEITIK